MSKIKQIERAIANGIKRESRLDDIAMSVPALTSINLRHILNNIGQLGTRFLEIGSHKGGTFCSTIFKNDNILSAISIDSFESDLTNEDKAHPQFLENVTICK